MAMTMPPLAGMSTSKMLVQMAGVRVSLRFLESLGVLFLHRPLAPGTAARLRVSDTLGRVPRRRIPIMVIGGIRVDDTRRTAEKVWRRAIDLDGIGATHGIEASVVLPRTTPAFAIAAVFIGTERVRHANRTRAIRASAKDGDAVTRDVADIQGWELGIDIPVSFDPRTAAVRHAITQL